MTGSDGRWADGGVREEAFEVAKVQVVFDN
jgi:hypothetical protein